MEKIPHKLNPLEDEAGRVTNPDLAHDMANAEAPYHEANLKNKIRNAASRLSLGKVDTAQERGERAAQEVEDSYFKTGEAIPEGEVPKKVQFIIQGYIEKKYNGAMDMGLFDIQEWRFVSYDGKSDRKNGRYIVRGTIDYHDEYGRPVSKGMKNIAFEVKDGELVI